MYTIPFQTTTWADIPATEHPGESGRALWRTKYHGDLRLRLIEYSPAYKADHWCELGHLLFCLEGELDTELRDGSPVHLAAGMSYEVSDGLSSHKSRTQTGAKLLIVDGGFLRGKSSD
jgi:hypothetical protein